MLEVFMEATNYNSQITTNYF